MKTALLVIDVQNTLCVGKWAVHDVAGVVNRINAVATKVRDVGGSVIFIQHEEDHDAMRVGSEGWQLYGGLAVEPTDVRVRKTACDSFLKTDLLAILQQRQIKQLVICGMQSEFCVDSTVRGALSHGYPVVLVADGHSTLSNEVLSASQISAHHNVTLANIGSYGPTVLVKPATAVCTDV